jgi:hypothetical protein
MAVNLLLAAFGWMAADLIDGWRRGQEWPFLPALIYLGICLAYEAFYLQFLPLLCVGALFLLERVITRAAFLKSALTLVAAQAVAVLWHELSKFGTARGVSANWGGILSRNLKMIPAEMVISAFEVRFALAGSLAIFAALAFVVIFRAWRRGTLPVARFVVFGLAGTSGVLFAVVTMSMGERILAGTGVESRTYTLPSFGSRSLRSSHSPGGDANGRL